MLLVSLRCYLSSMSHRGRDDVIPFPSLGPNPSLSYNCGPRLERFSGCAIPDPELTRIQASVN